MAETVISIIQSDQWPEHIFRKLADIDSLWPQINRRLIKSDMEEWRKRLGDLNDEVEAWWDDFRDFGEAVVKSALLHKVCSFIPSLCSRLKKTMVVGGDGDADIASKAKALYDKLDEFLRDYCEAYGFHRNDQAGSSSSSRLQLQMPNDLRTLIKKALSDKLTQLAFNVTMLSRSSTSAKVTLISVVGNPVPDVAKKAARQLYDDDIIKTCFELRKWVELPSNFDEETLGSAILGNHAGDSGMLFDLIRDHFGEKTFLLVLEMDSVQTVNTEVWEPFKDSLKQGAPGSIIIATTLDTSVAKGIGSDYTHVEDLHTPEYHRRIMDYVYGSSIEHAGAAEDIVKGILDKCGGLVFNINIIGSHMKCRDSIEEWKDILNSKIWEIRGKDSEFWFDFAPIYISYNDLSFRQQLCFLYISAFPVGTDINVERLIRLWMAEGYLGAPTLEGEKVMKMRGYECLNVLSMRCFFDKFAISCVDPCEIISFQMHKTVHAFAKWLRKNETSSAAVKAIWRSFTSVFLKPEIDLQDLLRHSKNFRALDLSYSQLKLLPREVGNLRLLQHLDLSGNPLEELPETICDLRYLEFLDVHLCYLLSSLPQSIGELQQLRSLRIDHTTQELQLVPQGFEKLTSLRTLDIFRVGSRYNDLAKLDNMKHLEEISIAIYGIKDLKDPRFESKEMLHILELRFVGEGRDAGVETIVNKFQPPPNLQVLKLEGYPGLRLPTKWLNICNNLKRLTLTSAFNLLSLNAVRELSCLEFLWLSDIQRLKHLGREFFGLPNTSKLESIRAGHSSYEKVVAFRNLRTLRIESMDNWEIWEDLNQLDMENTDFISVMKNLRYLIIDGCPKLRALPHQLLTKIMPKVEAFNDGSLLDDGSFILDGQLLDIDGKEVEELGEQLVRMFKSLD